MKAHKKPSILIPATNLSANKMIITLMINRNSPSVTMVKGRVKIINKGFTIKFKSASTNAKTMAVVNELIVTCGTKTLEST